MAVSITQLPTTSKTAFETVQSRVATWISWVYIGLGNYESAMDWLERGYETKANWMPFINVHFFFESLRGQPRFQRLVQRMGLEK